MLHLNVFMFQVLKFCLSLFYLYIFKYPDRILILHFFLACTWGAVVLVGVSSSPSTMCILGMEFRWLILVADAFTHWAILLAHYIIILIVHIYEVQHAIQTNCLKYGN